jgi:archaellum component FlaG (FlaF/FlaG flagellin family)
MVAGTWVQDICSVVQCTNTNFSVVKDPQRVSSIHYGYIILIHNIRHQYGAHAKSKFILLLIGTRELL